MTPTTLLTTVASFALGAAVATSLPAHQSGESEMAKVHGIGGIFFTSEDPAATQKWYVETLGITELVIDSETRIPLIKWRELDDSTSVGTTVFDVFPEGAAHLSPSSAKFMINYRVRDIEMMREQVKVAGGTLLGEIEDHFNGRFAWFLDPDGRKVELWQPGEGF